MVRQLLRLGRNGVLPIYDFARGKMAAILVGRPASRQMCVSSSAKSAHRSHGSRSTGMRLKLSS